jgi:tight adherence protein B
MFRIKTRISGFLDTLAGIRSINALIAALSFSVFFLWSRNIILAAVISICFFIYTADLFYNRKRIINNLLHRQLISFLEYMIIMLRAGKTIRYIMLESWSRFPPPLESCLKQVAQRLEIDPDLEKALDLFEDSTGSREAALITAGIKINSRVGGDLIILLQSLSATLRESLRSSSRIESLTLQSRFSANIISFFPVFALIFLYIFFNRSITDFFSTAAGTITLIAGGLLEIAGILLMKKIVRGN